MKIEKPVPGIFNYLSTRLSHLSESNQRPTDYKSVALPAELKWHINYPPPAWPGADKKIKNYPKNFGKAKVREFAYCKNFETGIFCLFSTTCSLLSGYTNLYATHQRPIATFRKTYKIHRFDRDSFFPWRHA